MANVTATVVVSFGDANAAGLLTAEIDSRPDGYNNGKTTFSEGDEPVILVRKGSNVNIDSVLTSLGACTQFATGSTAEKEFLIYVQTATATSSKPVSSGFSSQWYGNNLGTVAVKNDNQIQITGPTLPITMVGVLGITYTSDFIAYKLTGIPSTVNGEKTFQVVVAFIGSLV